MRDLREREKLFKALCELLPFNVMVNHTNSNHNAYLKGIDDYGKVMLEDVNDEIAFVPTDVFAIKPYLRKLDSITIAETKELKEATCPNGTGTFGQLPRS